MLTSLGFGGGAGVRQRHSQVRPGQSHLPFHSLPLHSGPGSAQHSGAGARRPSLALRLRLLKERLQASNSTLLLVLGASTWLLLASLMWLVVFPLLPDAWGCANIPFISGRSCWWVPPQNVKSHFIFVYDLPRKFHRDLLDRLTSRHLAQFQVDRLLFSYLQRNNQVRTTHPENATLFLVPVLPTLYLSLAQSQRMEASVAEPNATSAPSLSSSSPLDPLLSTSRYVEKALTYIQSAHPYWRRSNGRDHFIFASHEYGRCGLLPFVSPSVLGELFTLQPCGFSDLRLEALLTSPRLLPTASAQAAEASLQGPLSPARGVQCFHPGQDVTMPPLHASAPLIPPLSSRRPAFLLLLMGSHPSPASSTDPSRPSTATAAPLYERSAVRDSIEELVRQGIPSDWALSRMSLSKALGQMSNSMLCMCLPHPSYWEEVVCMVQSIQSGCVPVTFFHDHLHPWLGTFRFRDFTLNLDPMDVFEIKTRVEVLHLDPLLVTRLQAQLLLVQPRFLFNETLRNNTFDQLMLALQNKASYMLHGVPLEDLQLI